GATLPDMTTQTSTQASSPTSTTDRDATRARLQELLTGLSAQKLLIGLDVDGTLVDHDGVMSAEMHEVLQQTAEAHTVVIATGRSLGATLPIVEAAGVTHGFAVCS